MMKHMTVRVLTGSKQEIAARVAEIDGDIREAIVFIEERSATAAAAPPGTAAAENIFAEMEPYTVRHANVDDSREAIYRRMEGE